MFFFTIVNFSILRTRKKSDADYDKVRPKLGLLCLKMDKRIIKKNLFFISLIDTLKQFQRSLQK